MVSYEEGGHLKDVFKIMINVLVLFLVACLPSLFHSQHFSVNDFLTAMEETIRNLSQPHQIVFINQKSGVEHSLFPFIIGPWFNTLSILFSAIIISFILSLFLVSLMYRYQYFEKIIVVMNHMLSIIPDVFYVPISITAVIIIYQQTGTLLFAIASSQSSKAFIFPVLVLLVIPLVNSITLLKKLLDEERASAYVELAKAKGLNEFEVFSTHILRNLMIGYLIHMKQIVWITLSSLLFLERVMNIMGVSVFIFEYNSPVVLFITFLLLYIPIALLFRLSQFTVHQVTGRGMV